MADNPENKEASPVTPDATKPSTSKEAPSRDSSREAAGQPFELAVLALQNTTLFPETVVPLAVGRPRSVAAVEAALASPEKLIGCITVKPDRSDDTERKFLDFSASASRGMIRGRESFPDPMRILFKGPNGFGS